MIAAFLNSLRRRWSQLDPRVRQRYAIVALLIALACAIATSLWLRTEHARLSSQQGETTGHLKELQEQLAEIEHLKSVAGLPTLKGPALQAAIAASLQSRGLPLSVTAIDSDRLRVQGTADFDQAMQWLGSVQQSQRLGLTSMSASRQDGAAKLEFVLTAASQ